jgi:hypothetical protein
MEIKELNTKELSFEEIVKIEGGSEVSDAFCTFCGYVVHGAMVFATEGGRNAGLCVR